VVAPSHRSESVLNRSILAAPVLAALVALNHDQEEYAPRHSLTHRCKTESRRKISNICFIESCVSQSMGISGHPRLAAAAGEGRTTGAAKAQPQGLCTAPGPEAALAEASYPLSVAAP
jgi:hypothetical protein